MSPCQHVLLLANASPEPDESKDETEETRVNIQCLLTLLILLLQLHGLFLRRPECCSTCFRVASVANSTI